MMRVQVNMSASFRGYVEEYAAEADTTMPQAYKELLEAGLAVSNCDFDKIEPDAELDSDVSKVVNLDSDDYEIVITGNTANLL